MWTEELSQVFVEELEGRDDDADWEIEAYPKRGENGPSNFVENTDLRFMIMEVMMIVMMVMVMVAVVVMMWM